MKYLLVGLILIASALGRGGDAAIAPRKTFASAQFRTFAAGIETVVEIYLSTTPAPVRIGLSIQRTRRVCDGGDCQDVPILYGYTYQNAAPGDALVDRALANASVHAVIEFQDVVTRTTVPVRVDAVWTATGPAHCNDQYDANGCDRTASVTAAVEVTRSPLPLIAGQMAPDGVLQWRAPDWMT